MTSFNWIITISWLALMAYWLISAPKAKRSLRTGSQWKRGLGIRAVFVVVILLLLRFGVLQRASLYSYGDFTITPMSLLLDIIGAIFCVAGVVFAIRARTHLGRNWGMPMTLRKDHELVTSGPYARVRHPIYTGFLLAMLGTAFVDGVVWLIVLIFSGIYFIYSAKVEEKTMTEQFPNTYPEYKKRTKMLIPFVW